jgi:peptidoglycan/xylan/chitin deacetylase (PgdA/CDA1 family)
MSGALSNRMRDAVFLCYHSIAERGAPYLALPAGLFERQLALLRRRGYRSGGIEDIRRLARGERLARPTVFLTFDDGFRDNAETAWPLLREYGFRPLMFVLPGHLDEGREFDWPEVAEARASYPEAMRSLTWSQVDEMVGQGAEIGSHTLTHPHLRELDDEQLAYELAESRAQVERRLGACDTLAYPFGECDERVVEAARSAGYNFAFSLPQGPESRSGPLRIPRLNVDRRDRAGRFQLKLSPLGRRFLLSEAAEWTRRLRGSLAGGGRSTA